MVDMTLNDLYAKVEVILLPIDFLYTTSYRLSIVTFAIGRTVYPQYITLQTDRQTTDATL